jgi:WD40 repeat protein
VNVKRVNWHRLLLLTRRGAGKLGAAALAASVLATSAMAAPMGSQAKAPGLPSRGPAGSHEGFSVAISGNYAVVGAPGAVNDTGAAYVYQWANQGGANTWSKVATLPDPRKAKNDGYAWAVAISSTEAATYVAVGGNEQNGKRDFIYIYEGSGKTWRREASIADPGSNSTDLYGEAMAVSSTVLVVGAPGINGNMGTIYLYDRSGRRWNLQAAEVDPGDASGDTFGRSVSTSGDEVLAGAVGLAYVFTNVSGNKWTETAVLRNPGAAKDNFGYAASLDATTAVIGAPGGVPGTRIGSPPSAGAVYVFTRKGSAWSAPEKLTAPAGIKGDEFGISATDTGAGLLIGMPVYGTVNCGTAFTFALINGAWVFQKQVLNPTCAKGDQFGFSAAISGALGIIGAPGANNGEGAVFFPSLPPTSPEATLHDPGGRGDPAVAFSADNTILAAGDLNSRTYLWNVASRTVTAELHSPNRQGVFALAFSPDLTTLAVGTGNGNSTNHVLYLWNLSSDTVAATLSEPGTGGIGGLAITADAAIIAAGDDNGSTYLWDAPTDTLLNPLLRAPASEHVNGVAFNQDGTTLAVADNTGNTFLWNVPTMTLIATLPDPGSQGVNGVAFSPDGTTLATADANGNAYLWNVASGTLIATLHDPASKSLSGVEFSPNGMAIATATTNNTQAQSGISVWNVPTRSLIATFSDPASTGVYELAFTPDGSTVAVGDVNGRTYLWDMSWLDS